MTIRLLTETTAVVACLLAGTVRVATRLATGGLRLRLAGETTAVITSILLHSLYNGMIFCFFPNLYRGKPDSLCLFLFFRMCSIHGNNL